MADVLTQNANVHLRVELIDPSTRRLIKSWKFAPQDEITLGRAPDRDVEVADPYVSRHHASLAWKADGWCLVSYGRNGVLVAGNPVQEYPATDGLVFRLGAQGPEFRFHVVPGALKTGDESTTGTETIQIAANLVPELLASVAAADELKLQIDQQRLSREVNDIVETEYFQRLQGLSKQLKQQRSTNT